MEHFVDGVSTTVIKTAEKVGMIDNLNQLLRQDKLLPDAVKLSVVKFIDRAFSMLSPKSIESLGILAVPIQKSDTHFMFNFMMQLSNAPLYNLNQASYNKLVINCFIQRLNQC